jgi:hypothetical protein
MTDEDYFREYISGERFAELMTGESFKRDAHRAALYRELAAEPGQLPEVVDLLNRTAERYEAYADQARAISVDRIIAAMTSADPNAAEDRS